MAEVIFGEIFGVRIGQIFASRRELHDANVHRGLMRGIAPGGSSIVLSGGYVDDEDYGEQIIYTGEGGNDLGSGHQIADQTLSGGNLALARNCDEGRLIRVNRGSKLDSHYAPARGYRYDGLYRVESYWQELGQDGYLVWRFRLEEHSEQKTFDTDNLVKGSITPPKGTERPGRAQVTVSRVVRSTVIGDEVKRLHNYTCQICGLRLETPAGAYAECCHIKPLGRPHSGPDTLENVLCLCANCHVLLDKKAILIADDLGIEDTNRSIRQAEGHNVNPDYLAYHRGLIRQ
jgi:putative restriction endonuclease